MYREYSIGNKKKKIILIVFSIVVTILIFLTIKNIFVFYKEAIVEIGDNENNLLKYMTHNNGEEGIITYFIYAFLLIIVSYQYFLQNIGMIIDDNSIKLYSIHTKKPSKEIFWSQIKSLQIGNVYMGRRDTSYCMKIRYLDDIEKIAYEN
ncbi:hypothetical protein [Tepidibacter aestuarii]|uniref:hypothetical protein n=1 Tax=Tepidibacter aestuarii TaxID=2925782 RepID=UPI0020BF8979|nr:hypothetical protein [Tepidibacter aestuarii]CAH2212983.1 protein of unknown function [Tepidibacter aestuarii]